ncbi:hypothetical protein [Planomonospora venezuelensis]|uniref:Uncharacterized protein n=1 Tax=Planomonospora venezuelensis TaxID=1999 RepID=A0A841D5A0_PLAVE|nr:hypothetical protein [Planomonospora venezuelensis]MBB5963674.1 hypothetical protein [Planomonospora venezuelensis]GIN01463.1 hypothetical protein Pve01_31210 [Planomonospora venezuelensis]
MGNMTAVRHWDGFDAIESEVRAMVADPRWPAMPLPARARAVALRTLATPDGGRWLFGAHARWYRQDPGDGRWQLAPPPADAGLRAGAHVVDAASAVLPHLVPAGPDFTADRGSVQGFVGPDVPPEVTERVRALVVSQRGRRREDFPLHGPFSEVFAGEVASPVAAIWGTLMWCAYAPAFDGNELLLSVFGEFLARPLPGDEWVRWLPPVSLDDLAALYGERVRAGHPEAGRRLVALMADTAGAVRGDPRFRPRAAALAVMLAPVLRRTGQDAAAAGLGDEEVRQAWLSRCPPHVTLAESSPGEHFQHTVYDLVQALGFLAARGADPRAVAGALLAADVAAHAPRAADRLYAWLDPELRHVLRDVLTDPAHPLRRCWPRPRGAGSSTGSFSGPSTGSFAVPSPAPPPGPATLPSALHPPDRASAAALLGAAYATGLAWCRLTGTAVPERGFPTASALVHRLAHERDDPVPGSSGTYPRHF